MAEKLNVVFFGSFNDFSVLPADRLRTNPKINLSAVITTPPAPAGRHLTATPNLVQVFSDHHQLPCFTPEKLDDQSLSSVSAQLPRPDFLVVAGYAKLLSPAWLTWPKIIPVNLHQSLLPQYPGRCPAEWAILNHETQTGVTLIKMNLKFDAGEIITQKTLPISPDDTRLTLYAKLYDLGADLLTATLPDIAAGKFTLIPQSKTQTPVTYARQITRQDGFISYPDFVSALKHPAGPEITSLTTKFRAFTGWPGVWTITPQQHRLKLMALKPQILLQPEGKKPMPLAQLPL